MGCETSNRIALSCCRVAFGTQELAELLAEDSIKGCPFLVLGNKVDLKNAVSEAQLKDALGLTNVTTGKDKDAKVPEGMRPLEVYMCSVVKKAGYADGFKWLSNHLK